jgi:uncharacterized protein YecT (DUF1311 family)
LANGLALAQTSPNGTFKIESETKPAPSPIEGTDVADFVVSTKNPKLRQPLGEHPETTNASYHISPDEQWIFDEISYSRGRAGGQLYKRHEDLKFQPVEKDFEESIWHFFDQNEHVNEDDRQTSLIDFVAWSPDSGRLLVDLRGGGFGGDDKRGIYLWYAYFNTKTQKFELTDYLRKLNQGAWQRWKDFQPEKTFASFPEAASAEPLAQLPPETELKKRYHVADSQLNKTYNQVLAKIDKEQQTSLRDDQRDWIKRRNAGAKLYKESGDKSTAERRYWQYMLDSTKARISDVRRYSE